MLSQKGSALPPRETPLPVIVGVRIGLVDGEISSVDRKAMVGNLVAKLSEANVFQKVMFPSPEDADLMLDVGAKVQHYPPSRGLSMIGNILVCGFSVMLMCPQGSSEYEYTVSVRAVMGPTNEEINRYLAVGRSRVTYSGLNGEDAHREAWRLAVTSAYDQLITQMREDEGKFQVGAGAEKVHP